jgi:Cu(I)/Ag(I) efflux system membrane fusion protein
MNRPVLIVAGLTIGALLAGGGYYLGRQASTAHTSAQQPAAAQSERRILYWHDPMVPDKKFDKPGKSPFMDMQLVPVYADEAGAAGQVTISSNTMQSLGIRTAEVKRGPMDMGMGTVGTVAIDERTISDVQARASGYVERLYVRAQYDKVARGQPLVDIYSPEWLAAQEEYLALRSGRIESGKQVYQAARERLLRLGISEQQISRIERDGKASPRVTLYAPRSGLVWELGVRDGQAVNPGMTLFKLAALDSVWVNAEVPESLAAAVTPGVAVEGHSAATPERVFKGKVAALLPEINPTTRTVKARIVLANPDHSLQPGMFARIDFTGGVKQALLVPSEAVIHTGRRSVVILAEAEGRFRPVDVELGRESNDLTEVRKGLVEGQKVVVSGQFLIDSEASLKTTLDRLQGAAPKGPGSPDSAPGRTP